MGCCFVEGRVRFVKVMQVLALKMYDSLPHDSCDVDLACATSFMPCHSIVVREAVLTQAQRRLACGYYTLEQDRHALFLPVRLDRPLMDAAPPDLKRSPHEKVTRFCRRRSGSALSCRRYGQTARAYKQTVPPSVTFLAENTGKGILRSLRAPSFSTPSSYWCPHACFAHPGGL